MYIYMYILVYILCILCHQRYWYYLWHYYISNAYGTINTFRRLFVKRIFSFTSRALFTPSSCLSLCVKRVKENSIFPRYQGELCRLSHCENFLSVSRFARKSDCKKKMMILSPRFLLSRWKNATMLRRFFGFRRGSQWISAEPRSADPGRKPTE